MYKEEIHLSDWHRILVGDAPVAFLAEVALRTILIYLFLLVVLRLMGKRMSAQLTLTEMAVMITLGAIVSLPMQQPETGILQGFLVLTCALLFQRGFNFLNFKSQRFEDIAQGAISILVNNGELNIQEMQRNRISREQLFAQLRAQGILNLGEVARVYLEPSGSFSIYQREEAFSGLSTLPESDSAMKARQPRSAEGLLACGNCGRLATENGLGSPCTNCGSKDRKQTVSKEE